MGRRGHRGGGRPEGGFGPQGRARRGEARFVLLDALKGGAMHGYEIIKSIEERSQGQYSPSPGTVYPTMQFLEDLGFVKANQDAERKVFTLTDLGRTELETHSAEIDEFWSRFSAPATSQATQAEISFLEEEIERLTRTVWTRLLSARDANNHEVIRKVRQAVERCQNEVRDIITAG
jgi:DNA-binding PadR family transcriptional regulator